MMKSATFIEKYITSFCQILYEGGNIEKYTVIESSVKIKPNILGFFRTEKKAETFIKNKSGTKIRKDFTILKIVKEYSLYKSGRLQKI